VSRPHVIHTKRRGHTLALDTARAARFELMAREAFEHLFTGLSEDQRPGMARALVQEAVRRDAIERGEHEARAWAAKQGRAA
jgi:hypothetical protein